MPLFNALSQMEITGDGLTAGFQERCACRGEFDKSLRMALLWFLCISQGILFLGFFKIKG